MSATVEIVNALGVRIDHREVATPAVLGDVLMGEWPTGFPGFAAVVQEDGQDLAPEIAAQRKLSDGGQIRVRLLPKGPLILGVKLGYWLLAAVSLIAAKALMPKIPGNNLVDYQWEDNTSNFAAAQGNRLRPGGRVPDVYGKIRVYPDLIAPSYSIFNGNAQKLTELFVVTNGWADLSQVSILDDEIGGVYSGNYDVLHPGKPLPDSFRIVTENITVTNSAANAPNDVFNAEFGFLLSQPNSRFEAGVDFAAQLNLAVGQSVYLGGASQSNNRVYTITGLGSGSGRFWINVNPAPAVTEQPATAWIARVLSTLNVTSASELVNGLTRQQVPPAPSWWNALPVGTRIAIKETNTVHTVGSRGSTTVGQASGPDQKLYTVRWSPNAPTAAYTTLYVLATTNYSPPPPPSDGGFRNWSPWFALPGNDATEIWIDFSFMQGLFVQFSNQPPQEHYVRFTIEVRNNVTGAISTGDVVYGAVSRQPRRWTHIIPVARGSYSVRWRRVNNAYAQSTTQVSAEAATVSRLASVRRAPSDTLPGVTALLLEFDSQLGEIQSSRKVNCIVERRLPDYQTPGSPLRQSRSLADAVAHTLLDLSHYPRANVDLVSLYDLFKDRPFDAVIDSEMSTDDQVQLMLNAWSGGAYRRAGVIYFLRDQPQSLPRTLFNRRNKIEPETRTMMFGQINDPDGVELTFMDAAQNYKQITVQYPATGLIWPRKVSMVGLTDYTDAWRRAMREYLIILNRRDTLSVPVGEEGILLAPGDMVAVTDHLLETPIHDGEIAAITGQVLQLDKPLPAVHGDVIRLRDKTGVLVQEAMILGETADSVTIADPLTVSGPASDHAQTGLLYEILGQAQAVQNRWIVQRIDVNNEGAATLLCTNYSEAIYAADTATPPQARRLIGDHPHRPNP